MSSGKAVPSEAESRRAWAAEFLEHSPQISPQEAQSQWLSNLEEQDFVPYEGSYEALQVLTGKNGRELPTREYEIQLHRERELIQAVDAMADTFFQYAPEERRKRWEALEYKCRESSRARAQLFMLQPGLDLPLLDRSEDTQADDLVRLICQLFTLNPLRRGQRMQELWNLVEEDPEKWEAAARRVKRDRPLVADLLPREFKRLTTLQAAMKREASYADRKHERVPDLEEVPARPSGSNWWIPVVIAIVIASVGQALRNHDSRPKPPSYTPYINTAPSDDALERVREMLKKHESKVEQQSDRFPPSSDGLGEEEENRLRLQARQRVQELLGGPLSEDGNLIPNQDGQVGVPSEKERVAHRLAEITGELIELEQQAKQRQMRFETDLAADFQLMRLRAENKRLWKVWKELQSQDSDQEPTDEDPSPTSDIFQLSP